MGRRCADSNVNSLKISTVYWPRKMAIADAINAGGEFNSNAPKRHARPSPMFTSAPGCLMALGQNPSA
ncbi:hypothetical protein F4W70_22105 [Pseudomonas cannabina]|nr:hypothetical protein F4W70_22105 [Pseudomonas cannabina]